VRPQEVDRLVEHARWPIPSEVWDELGPLTAGRWA
jgi:hypothetical protein